MFFPSKNSANESLLTLYYSLSTPFLFLPFLEAYFFPHSGRICMWLLWLHNVNCNSLLIPNKPIFLLEKYLAVCLCQVNNFVTHWGSEKILKAFRAGEQTSACTQHFSISCFTSYEVLVLAAPNKSWTF